MPNMEMGVMRIGPLSDLSKNPKDENTIYASLSIDTHCPVKDGDTIFYYPGMLRQPEDGKTSSLMIEAIPAGYSAICLLGLVRQMHAERMLENLGMNPDLTAVHTQGSCKNDFSENSITKRYGAMGNCNFSENATGSRLYNKSSASVEPNSLPNV